MPTVIVAIITGDPFVDNPNHFWPTVQDTTNNTGFLCKGFQQEGGNLCRSRFLGCKDKHKTSETRFTKV